jgi:hypothetical protein
LIFAPACTSNPVATVRSKVFRCLSLDPKSDFIFYQVIKPKNNDEIWAFDVSAKKSALLPKELDSINMSTPPDGNWLFFDDNSINALDLDNCDGQTIYKVDSHYTSFDTVWVSKNLLLINAFEEYPFTPDLYAFDLKSKKAKRLGSDEFIQGVSIPSGTWIQSDGVVLETVQEQGTKTRILEDFTVATEISPGAIQFLPNTEDFIFIAARKGSADYALWKSSLKQDKPQIIVEIDQDASISYYQISPDGNYLGFVKETSTGSSLVFLNLKTNKVDFQWHYPIIKSSPGFSWSPDSKFVAMPYEDMNEALYMGIQIMQITSGELNIVLRTTVDWVVGWYSAK